MFDYWLLNGEAWKKDSLPPLNPEEVAAIHDYAYTPAVSPGALESIRATIKSLNIPRQTPGTLAEIAKQISPLLRGWIGYCGRFTPSALATLADYCKSARITTPIGEGSRT